MLQIKNYYEAGKQRIIIMMMSKSLMPLFPSLSFLPLPLEQRAETETIGIHLCYLD